MARLMSNVNSGICTTVAATAKTILQIKVPQNTIAVIRSIRFNGLAPAGGVNSPMTIKITRSTANFGTGSAAVAVLADADRPETSRLTCYANFSVEPTTPTDTGKLWTLNPQGTLIEAAYPPYIEVICPGGSGASGTSYQFQVTTVGGESIGIECDVEE